VPLPVPELSAGRRVPRARALLEKADREESVLVVQLALLAVVQVPVA
jgi:hypothetical protein